MNDKQLEKIHDDFNDVINNAIDEAEPLGTPHIVMQGLAHFMSLAFSCAPSEFEARRLIKFVTKQVWDDLKDEVHYD